MAGIDRNTGRILDGWPHVTQSLMVLFVTSFGERMLRRWFGSLVPGLLGENLTKSTVLQFFSAVTVAIELWEPRFRVVKVTPLSVDRQGELRIRIEGAYRPRAHLGDFTEQDMRSLTVSAGASGIAVA